MTNTKLLRQTQLGCHMSAIDELSLKFKSGNDVPVEFARFSPDEWAQVVAERDGLKAALIDGAVAKTMLNGIAIRNGGLELQASGGMCGVIAASFAEMLQTSKAVNYLEMTFESGSHPEIGKIVVTVQRCSGQTPHQLRLHAEEERDQLRDLNHKIAAELDRLSRVSNQCDQLRERVAELEQWIVKARISLIETGTCAEDLDAAMKEQGNG